MTNPFEAVEQAMDSHQQHMDVARHEIASFIRGLNREDLSTLSMLLRNISMAGEAASNMAGYFQGITVASLEYKFNECLACGVDHSTPEALIPHQAGPRDASPRELHEPLTLPTQVGATGELTADQMSMMDKYNLDDLREEGTNKLLGFVCLGCKSQVQSIEDRMKEKPGVEGCSGCQQKAKFG